MKIFLQSFRKGWTNIPTRKKNTCYGKLKLLIALLLILIGGPGLAQQVSFKKKGVSLETTLKEIGNQSGYTFFYKKEDLSNIQKLNVSLTTVPLRDAVRKVLEGTGLEFEVFDKTIVVKKISRKAEPTDGTALKELPSHLIKGVILDENNLPLEQILIREIGTKVSTRSKRNGEFTISVGATGDLSFLGARFMEQLISFTDTTSYLKVKMQTIGIELSDIVISKEKQKDPVRFVELKNRNYMNLSQVLQGTVPGLSLQTVTATSKEVTSVDAFVYIRNGQVINDFVRFSVEEFLAYRGRAVGQNIIDQLLSGKNVPNSIKNFNRLNVASRTTSSLVPQIRGANNFAANSSSMLVVIDGFPQDGFPADYSMINVESIEVIKDQKELTKWGPRASGGIIMIKSKSARKGHLEVNYTTNFYFSKAPKFDRAQMKLLSGPQYLSYIRDLDSIFATPYNAQTTLKYTPAKQLFAQRRQNQITQAVFAKRYDSLANLDNQDQMNMLSQDRFSQNHTIGLNGGVDIYKFNLIGNFFDDRPSELNGYAKTYAANLNNEFSFFKKKLNISWLINYSNSNSRSGYSFNPFTNIEPYQMLLDANGGYVNDYSAFSPYANAVIMANGYKDYGVNILQDANLNRQLNKTIQKKSNFNSRWDLLPGLRWTSSFYYTSAKSNIRSYYDRESSYVRQLVDNYGEYTPTGINYYLPYGGILQANNRDAEEINLRSALNYTKVIGKHQVDVTIGGGAASIGAKRPSNATLYGYDPSDNTSAAVFLPSPNPRSSISNFYSVLPTFAVGSSVNPYTLTTAINGDTTISRNVNANAAISYSYSDRLRISGQYSEVYNPLYGQSTTYSTSTNYKGDVTGMVLKNIGWIFHSLLVSTGIDGMKLPNLPVSYNNIRFQQTTWNNYGVWVNGLSPTQQKGQSSRVLYQKLTLSLLDSTLTFNGAYNTQLRTGTLSSLSADPALGTIDPNAQVKTHFFSAGLSGNMRKGLLMFNMDYSRSPEGQAQLNGGGNYDIAHESYFHSKLFNSLDVGFKIQNISSFQGLNIMMGTNVASGGSFGQATNSDFSLLPPKNTSYEASIRGGLHNDDQSFDFRFYSQSSSGLNNNIPVVQDPATGVPSRVTYSKITNKGIEFFLKSLIVRRGDFEYSMTLNGAYNVNIADQVPAPAFTGDDNFATVYRQGYDISNVWSVQSGPLNNKGNPQIYNAQGILTSTLDSATVAGSLVYSGVSRAPWTGGLIHDLNYKQFFARASMVFNLGHVMRTYLPYLNATPETSALANDRWRKPGDEAFTAVPRISGDGTNFASYAVRNGTNTIVSADNVRLQEVMLGMNISPSFLKKIHIKMATIALSGQNLAVWTRNKDHIDPLTLSGIGRIGMPLAKQFSCNLSVSF